MVVTTRETLLDVNSITTEINPNMTFPTHLNVQPEFRPSRTFYVITHELSNWQIHAGGTVKLHLYACFWHEQMYSTLHSSYIKIDFVMPYTAKKSNILQWFNFFSINSMSVCIISDFVIKFNVSAMIKHRNIFENGKDFSEHNDFVMSVWLC